MENNSTGIQKTINKMNQDEINRIERNQRKWATLRKSWSEWKKNNPEKARAHALLKAKLNGKSPKSL